MALCPELRINAMQTRFLQNLCSGLALLSSDFSSTHQNDLKPGQCLDIHDITPSTKFGDVTLPSSHFTARSVF